MHSRHVHARPVPGPVELKACSMPPQGGPVLPALVLLCAGLRCLRSGRSATPPSPHS